MAVLDVADLRARIAAAVEALAAPSAWKESPNPALYPRDPGRWAHLSFAVTTPRTLFRSPVESSRLRRGTEGGLVDTTVLVRWVFRLRGDAMVADYDAALDAELVLMKALLGVALTDLHLELVSADRPISPEGEWLIGQVTLTAQHRLSLA